MGVRTSLVQYKPGLITLYDREFPAICHDHRDQAPGEKPSMRGFIPRLILTPEEMAFLEKHNFFTNMNVSARTFMMLQFAFPKVPEKGKKSSWRMRNPKEVNKRVCAAFRHLIERLTIANRFEKGLIKPIYVTPSYFREVFENFDSLRLGIQVHGESLMQFVIEGHVIEVMNEESLIFPDTTDFNRAEMEHLSIEEILSTPRKARRTAFKAVAMTGAAADTWVITKDFEVKTYWDILGIRNN